MSEVSTMHELLSNPIFIIFASITLMSVIPSVAHYWHKVRQAELEASLKHEMLQRGMSAEEIRGVLAASLGGGSSKKCWQSQSHKS
jgi:hypothetical protein